MKTIQLMVSRYNAETKHGRTTRHAADNIPRPTSWAGDKNSNIQLSCLAASDIPGNLLRDLSLTLLSDCPALEAAASVDLKAVVGASSSF